MVTREEVEHYSNEFFEYIKTGKLKIKFFKTYKLEDLRTAHEVCLSNFAGVLRVSFDLTIIF